MLQKRIVFTAPGVAQVLDVDMPKIESSKVLVKLMVSTVSSGTERANITGEANVSADRANLPVSFPRYAGYSSSGVVVETGEGVQSLRPGDRVALSWSSHMQYVCLEEKNVMKIEDDHISFEEAALCHIGTFPLAAIRKCRVEIGEPVLVMGVGILGMMAILQLRAAGAVPVIAADPVAAKREKALELGADYAFDPFTEDFAEQVKAVSHGGACAGIEATGFGSGLDLALNCMRKFGRIALLGCTRHSDFSIDYYHKVHAPGISLIGAHTNARPAYESSPGLWTARDDMRAQLDLLSLKRLNYRQLVEETHSPMEAPQVYHRLCSEKFFPVVQFDWREME